jgi:methylaspartate ammonia-lyase
VAAKLLKKARPPQRWALKICGKTEFFGSTGGTCSATARACVFLPVGADENNPLKKAGMEYLWCLHIHSPFILLL